MKSKGVILMYHSVADRPTDAWGTSVTLARFADQLALLSKKFQIVSLRQVYEGIYSGHLSGEWIAVTFDDGYANNLHHATPLLQHYGIPATIFVVSGKVGSTSEFWWDEVERIFLGDVPLPDSLTLQAGAESLQWTTAEQAGPTAARRSWRAWMKEPETARQRAYREVHALMLTCTEKGRESLLRQLRAWAETSAEARAEYRALTSNELRTLVSHDCIEIGSHTATHTPLHVLSPDAVIYELASSKRSLEGIICGSVSALSYPFGAYLAGTLPHVAAAGYEYACSSLSHDDVCAMRAPTLRGVIDDTLSKGDRFQIPRVMTEDWTAEELNSRLTAWFDA